jgi:cellulose synthase/poly-beta-1,6-N-acetylglucosamine synthase-like glycosyltransferase
MLIDLLTAILLSLYLIVVFVLFIYAVNYYYLTVQFVRFYKRSQRYHQNVLQKYPLSRYGYPIVTIQLPIYNEKYVIERLLAYTTQIRYPRESLQIQVLDDSTDETVEYAMNLVQQYQDQGVDIQHIHRTNRVGYKAGALANGLNHSKGSYIAIFDADFLPPKTFLEHTIPHFFNNLNCALVQCRWGHINPSFSFLTQCQSIGIDGHFSVEQLGRNETGLLMNFNGTAGIFKREAIEQAGGWHHDTLTEDLDLSYRIQLQGKHLQYVFDEVVQAEIPPDLNAFKQQQYRWAKGSIQCARKLIPSVLRSDLSLWRKIQACHHLTYYSLHVWIILAVLFSVPLSYIIPQVIPPWVMIPGLILISLSFLGPFVMYSVSQRIISKRWRRLGTIFIGLFLLGTGVAVNNFRAVVSGLMGKPSSFVRTPKFDVKNRTDTISNKSYKVFFHKQVVFELLLCLYCFGGFVLSLFINMVAVTPFVLLFGFSFGYVMVLTIIHAIRH